MNQTSPSDPDPGQERPVDRHLCEGRKVQGQGLDEAENRKEAGREKDEVRLTLSRKMTYSMKLVVKTVNYTVKKLMTTDSK